MPKSIQFKNIHGGADCNVTLGDKITVYVADHDKHNRGAQNSCAHLTLNVDDVRAWIKQLSEAVEQVEEHEQTKKVIELRQMLDTVQSDWTLAPSRLAKNLVKAGYRLVKDDD